MHCCSYHFQFEPLTFKNGANRSCLLGSCLLMHQFCSNVCLFFLRDSKKAGLMTGSWALLAIESQRGWELKLGLSVSSAVRGGSALIGHILTEARMPGPCLKASSITVHTHTHRCSYWASGKSTSSTIFGPDRDKRVTARGLDHNTEVGSK